MRGRAQREIVGRKVIDELIYRCGKPSARFILALQARCSMRIGEVLGLLASEVNGRRLTIRRPKSGRQEGRAFMPEAERRQQGRPEEATGTPITS